MGDFDSKYGNLCRKGNHNIVFQVNGQDWSKSATITSITSTPEASFQAKLAPTEAFVPTEVFVPTQRWRPAQLAHPL
jgi:hypothetical protein